MNSPYPSGSGYTRRSRRAGQPRVIVIAPHPDDDVIGCGGMLQRLAARGARCCVVYVTDGSASHVKSVRFPPAVLREVREREARAAVKALGIRAKLIFLRAPDGKLAGLEAKPRDAVIAAIARIITAHRTRLVFTPWVRDPHPDHIATAQLVQAALTTCSRRTASVMYGVWLPVRGTAADAPNSAAGASYDLRLTAAELTRKRAAILAHRSQAGDLIDDDPEGFRITEELLAQWLSPVERFYRGAGIGSLTRRLVTRGLGYKRR